MSSLRTLTQNTTTSFLAGVSLVQTLAALKSTDARTARANAIGAAICLIAFWHYERMRGASDVEKTLLRYGDWVVTCPLLLLELQEMTEGEDRWTLGAVVLMILLGLRAKQTRGAGRQALFGASTLLLVAVVVATVRGARQNRELVAAFFAVWSLYPVAFLLDDARGNQAFDVLDAASKGLFGLYVAHTM